MKGKEQSSPVPLSQARCPGPVLSLPEASAGGNPPRPYTVELAGDWESGAGFLNYWHLVVRHKLLLVAASLLGLLLGVLVGLPFKPVFRATTSIEVLNLNEDFMHMRPAQSTVPGSDPDVSEEQTQAALLQSDSLLARVRAKLSREPSHESSPPTSGWQSRLHLGDSRQPPRSELLKTAAKSVKVSSTPRTRLLSISVDSTDPQLARDFAATLVREFIDTNIESRWASTHETSDWLNREIGDTRSNLRRSEDALQAYARNSGLLFTDQENQTNVATEKLQQIQQQLSSATAERIAKQSSYELARSSPPEALADVLNNPSLQALQARLDEAARQLASLGAVYNSGYSKLKQAAAEVSALREAFDRQRADLMKRIDTDYQGALRREKLLATAYDAQAREVAGQDERTVQYNILKRDVDSNRQLYDTMLQQMKQASIAVALHASNVRVVDPAYVEASVFPNFKLNALLGFFAGLICSLGFVLIRERSDRTLRTPGEIKFWAALPELGSIPRLIHGSNRISRIFPERGFTPSEIASGSALSATRPGSTHSTQRTQSTAQIVEAFHSVLTSVLLGAEATQEAGSILVFTSAEPADGKTSVVSNLANAATEIGKRVLLVDADLRRPRLHEIFEVERSGGLTDLLASETPESDWRGLIQHVQRGRLSLLTAGSPSRVATHLFHAPKFSKLLQSWKSEYDLILIDTPPAMHITDARVIGTQADGVVLVVRAEQTTRDALLALRNRFLEDRIRLLGCILNDWDPSRSAYAYPYHYRYYSSREELPTNA